MHSKSKEEKSFSLHRRINVLQAHSDPKTRMIDATTMSDPEVEYHISKVVAYLKCLDAPNIKAVADDFPYPRLYHQLQWMIVKDKTASYHQHVLVIPSVVFLVFLRTWAFPHVYLFLPIAQMSSWPKITLDQETHLLSSKPGHSASANAFKPTSNAIRKRLTSTVNERMMLMTLTAGSTSSKLR
jgi:hypothetical protein